jgi:hypothetical protein
MMSAECGIKDELLLIRHSALRTHRSEMRQCR